MNYTVIVILLLVFVPLTVLAQDDPVLPLERVPASDSELQNAAGVPVNQIFVDQQVLVVSDVINALDEQQSFAYIVQIQDGNGVTVSLGWLTGSLSPNQKLSPALSWTPHAAGVYHATVFVWQDIANPIALSHTLEIDIDVS